MVLVVFPGFFLVGSPVRDIVFQNEPENVAYQVTAESPIVMVVFDEMTSTALLDGDGRIDSASYPNFAALAQESYWFRNATTVASHTPHAIPALLTGKYPKYPSKPMAADYPQNLFTLLEGSYDLAVHEGATQLCPKRSCKSALSQRPTRERLRSLLTDISYIYLAIVVPEDLAAGLPVVTQSWRNFHPDTNTAWGTIVLDQGIASRDPWEDRAAIFADFVGSIRPSGRPTLHFLNILLPHAPWEYLPSGRIYNRDQQGFLGVTGLGLTRREQWTDDEFVVLQGFQRYLLQVGFVDTLLGNLVARLKQKRLYDRSLVVITADHGVSFRPGRLRRGVSEANVRDQMEVPLFIKAPNQSKGVLSDRHVQLIDVLPTVLELLGMPPPWEMNGVSAINAAPVERKELTLFNYSGKRFDVGPRSILQSEMLRRKLEAFGSGGTAERLFSIPPYGEIVGRRSVDVGVAEPTDVTIKLNRPALFKHVDPSSDFVPAWLTATLVPPQKPGTRRSFAISVNGIIRAVGRETLDKGGRKVFSALVPETSFRVGRNDIEVFLVSRRAGRTLLQPVGISARSKPPIVGFVGSVNGSRRPVLRSEQTVVVKGWAADRVRGAPVKRVEIIVNGEVIGSTSDFFERPDVVWRMNRPDFKRSGWAIKGKLPQLEVGHYLMEGRGTTEEGTGSHLTPKRFKVDR